MPRPKIRPQDRRRSVVACSSCKAAKIRCDSRSPCRACVKRGRPATCSYAGALRAHLREEVLEALDSLARDASPREQTPTSARGDREQDTAEESPYDVHHGTSIAAQPQTRMDQAESGGGSVAASAAAWEPNSRVTQSRMMLSSHGEKGP